MDYNYIKAARSLLKRVYQNDFVEQPSQPLDDDMMKVYESIVNECKSTFLSEDNVVHVHESPITQEAVERIVMGILRGETVIPEKEIPTAVLNDNFFWRLPADLQITRGINSENADHTLVNSNLLVDENHIIAQEEGRAALSNFYEMYGRGITLEEQEKPNAGMRLPKLNAFTRFVQRLKTPRGGYRQAVRDEYERVIRTYSGITNEKMIQNSIEWKMANLYSPDFMNSVLDNIKNGRAITVLDAEDRGLFENTASQVGAEAEEMYHNLPDMNEIFSSNIGNIYKVIDAQLEALSHDLRNYTSEGIEDLLKRVNYLALNDEYREYLGESGYRNVNVRFGKKENEHLMLNNADVPEAMKYLAEEIAMLVGNDELSNEEYLERATQLKYRFVRIHPFPDANGRTSRALMNMMITPRGMIAEFPKEQRAKYIDAMSEFMEEYPHLQEEYCRAICNDPNYANYLESGPGFAKMQEYMKRNTTVMPEFIRRDASEIQREVKPHEKNLEDTQTPPVIPDDI